MRIFIFISLLLYVFSINAREGKEHRHFRFGQRILKLQQFSELEKGQKSNSAFLNMITKIYSSPDFLDNCDFVQKNLRIKIASYLDTNYDQIIAIRRDLDTNVVSDNDKLAIGKLSVKVTLANGISSEEWSEDEFYSWKKIDELFQEVLKLDINGFLTPKEKRMVNRLYKNFLGIIPDDEDRANGRNKLLSKDSIKLLVSMIEKIDFCIAKNNCVNPDFNDEESSMIKNYYYYRISINNLEQLKKEITVDLNSLKMRKNTMVYFENGSLVLPLALSAELIEGKEIFQKIVEDIWQDKNHSLHINFSSEGDNLFKVVMDEMSGGRSYVKFQQKEVHLFQDVRSRSIAHEIGHVLGFRDEYFAVWDPKECRYMDQYNVSSIMSDQEGSVLSRHWDALEINYR